MQTLNFSIDIPQDRVINVAQIKQRIMDFATQLLNVRTDQDNENEDMERAMRFIDTLAVPGGENIPVNEDSIDSLVEQKY